MAISDRKVLYGINSEILTEELFSAQEIAAGANASSSAIDLNLAGGQFSIQLELTGDGTAKVEWIGSNDNTTFVTPNGVSEIATGLTVGTYIYSFTILAVESMKIKVTETGTSDAIGATVTLAVR